LESAGGRDHGGSRHYFDRQMYARELQPGLTASTEILVATRLDVSPVAAKTGSD